MILLFYVPRTASSWYASKHHGDLGIENMFEPFNRHNHTKEEMISHFNRIQTDKDVIMKLSYIQWRDSSKIIGQDILNSCIKAADDIRFFCRRDYNAQLQSYYVAKLLKDWSTPWKEKRTIPYNKELFFKLHNELIEFYEQHSKVYKRLEEKQLVISEDFMTPQNKYKRPIEWEQTPPTFEVDTVSYFQ